VTLKRRFLLYLAVVHLVFAACAVVFLRGHRAWLVAAEAVFAVTLVTGIRLTASFFRPLEMVRSGVRFLQDGDFGTRFRATGQADMDELVRVYNLMVERLRDERVRSEEQEHLLQKVLRESPGGISTLDVDGRVSSLSPAAESLLGVDADAVRGRPLSEAGSDFAAGLAALPLNETRVLAWRGRRRVRCQRLAFMDRGFPRSFLLLDELTAELHRSEKQAYEKLIRLMSHEVNNTSGAVQSLLQSCLAYRRYLPPGDREDFARALDVAISRTANLDEFMRGFADVVRLPAPRPHRDDLRPLLRQVAVLFRERCEAADVHLKLDLADDLPPVPFDAVQLEQAMLNIVKNAVEATESAGGSEVVIAAALRGGRVTLAVRDQGPGLDDETQAQLFTPFFTTRAGGQGLGLTMVQEILLGHGFDFSLENAADGGAVFTVGC